MKTSLIVIFFLVGFNTLTFSQGLQIYPQVYDLDIQVDYKSKKLTTTCKLTVINQSNNDIKDIPFILYRLLKVNSIEEEGGTSVVFTQNVKAFDDWSVYQVNSILAHLNEPLREGDSTTLTIIYEGHLLGYAETGMSYAKDHIDPDFTILRPDCLAYPILGPPEFSTLRSAGNNSFDYFLKITIPDSLVAVNGGNLIEEKRENGLVSFVYKSTQPSNRIDVVVGKYRLLKRDDISTYYFEKDSSDALKIYKVMTDALYLYSGWWGEKKGKQGFAMIEIPGNYGSQASENYILQTASAFNNPSQWMEIYHELSHLWNVKEIDIFPPRWNEGMATYIQYKTVDILEQRNILDEELTKTYRRIGKNESYSEIPLIAFGENNLTGRSYNLGFILFYLLNDIVGDETFNLIIRSFYDQYYETGANTDDFVNLANKLSEIDLSRFFNDWMYTTNYYRYMKENIPIENLSGIYLK